MRLWRFHLSGEQLLTISVSLAISTMIFLAVITIFVPKHTPSLLGDYETPHRVIAFIEGIEGPAVMEGGMLEVFGRRCVTSESVNVITFRNFIRVVPPGATVSGTTRVDEVRKGGDCVPSPLPMRVPEGVTPGVWRIDGIDISTASGDVKVWSSEEFLVVPK